MLLKRIEGLEQVMMAKSWDEIDQIFRRRKNQVYFGSVKVYWHHQGERESILAKMQGAETPDIDEQNQVVLPFLQFFGSNFLNLL